ncbi:MAG: ATP-binding protein [Succinivibrionaceae bacterium]
MAFKLRPRERDAIIQSLRSGVTPRSGLQYIQVGRVKEVSAIIKDLDCVADKGSTFKLIVGDFGAGKSFFIQLVKNIALEKGLVTMVADLAPDRRLQATNGQALNLYQELSKNISTRAKPDGNALNSIVEKFITNARAEAEETKQDCQTVIKNKLAFLNDYVGGFDFSLVIQAYWKGYDTGNQDLMNCAIKWLRGEYHTKIEAKNELGVRTIIDDASVYDFYKLLSSFVQAAGYKGLIICMDEMVNLYKIYNIRSREANYEQILRIINDCLQGTVSGLGFIMGGTPDFLEDPRKGLFSYEALRSRLAPNSFAKTVGINDLSGPVMYLNNLTPEELYVLLDNLRKVFAYYDESKYLVPDEALPQFLYHCSKIIGESYFKTPRNTIKAFVDFLSILEQNQEIRWQDLLKDINISLDTDSSSDLNIDDDESDNSDDLSTFSL